MAEKKKIGKAVGTQSAVGTIPRQSDVGALIDSLFGLDRGTADAYTTVPMPFAEDSTARTYAEQLLAGAAELPYYAGAPYALLGWGQDEASQALFGTAPGEMMLPGTQELFQVMGHGTQKANEAFGATDPMSVDETLVRALPNLIGGAVLAPAKTATKSVARDVAEVLTPLTLAPRGQYLPYAAANVGVGTIAGDVMGDVLDPQYTSFIDEMHGFFGPDRKITTTGVPLVDGDPTELIKSEYERVNNDPAAASFEMSMRQEADDQDDFAIREEEALLAVFALFGARRAKQMFKAPGGMTPRPAKRAVPLTSKLDAAIGDQLVTLTDAARKISPRDGEYMHGLAGTRLNPLALEQSLEHARLTGELPEPVLDASGNVLKIPSIRQVEGALQKALTPQEYKDFNTYLLYKEELDLRTRYFANTGNIGYLHHPDIDTVAMEAIVRAGNTNPKFLAAENQVRKVLDGVLEYRMRRGAMSPNEFAAWRRDYPYYVPRIGMDETDIFDSRLGPLFKTARQFTPESQAPFLKRRTNQVVQPGSGQHDNYAPPTLLLDQYMTALVRDTERNATVSEFASLMDAAHRAGNSIGGMRIMDQADSGGKSISFTQNGREKHLFVGDPSVATALRARPAAYIPMINAIRRTSQFFTTGFGNPGRIVWTAMYDLFLAPSTKKKGVKIGFLGTPFDPTDSFKWPVGVANYLRAGMAREFAHIAHTRVLANVISGNTDNVLTKMAGGHANLRRFGNYMGKVYARSTLSEYERLAGGQGRFTNGFDPNRADDVANRLIATMNHGLASGTAPTQTARRVVSLVADALHNGLRLEAHRRSVPRTGTRREKVAMTGKIRDLGADAAKIGSAGWMQHLTSGTRFFNQLVQTTRQVLRQMKERPHIFAAQSSVFLAGVVGLMAYNSQGPERRKHYWSLPSRQRTGGFIWYDDDKPLGAYNEIDLDPVQRIFNATAQAALDYFFGFSDGRFEGDPALQMALDDYMQTLRFTDGLSWEEAQEYAMNKMRGVVRKQDLRAGVDAALDPGVYIPLELLGDTIGIQPISSPWDIANAGIDAVEGRNPTLHRDTRTERLTGGAEERTPGEIAPRYVADVMDTVMGLTGAAVYSFLDGMQMRADAGRGTSESIDEGLDELAYTMIGKQLPAGNMLFGEIVPDSWANADAVTAIEKVKALDEIVKLYGTQEKAPEFTSQRNPQPLGGYTNPKLFETFIAEQDPSIPLELRTNIALSRVRAIGHALAFKSSLIAKSGLLTQAQALKDEIESVSRDPRISPKLQREQTAVRKAEIARLYSEILIRAFSTEEMINFELRRFDPNAEEVTLETLLP